VSIEDEKRIMIEIYREAVDNGRYRVIYFTELGEHERETEIGKAARGDHVFDGFILSRERGPAKQVVERILEQMNNGSPVDPIDIERELKPFMAP
jgi:hypothetical protein